MRARSGESIVNASGSTPMEVDRVYRDGRGWNGGKKGDKGKGKGPSSRSFPKGKAKGKMKTKDGEFSSKGKQKSGSKGKHSGKYDGSGKGKGDKSSVACHKCGKVGHFARDCWAPNVRQVQSDAGPSVQTTPAATVAGSRSSKTSAQMPLRPSSHVLPEFVFLTQITLVQMFQGMMNVFLI